MQLLNICHSNAQSINAHIFDVSKIACDNNIHIFGITESHLHPSFSSSLIAIPNYTLHRVDRMGKKRRGVAIYVHESISAKEVCRSAQPVVYQKRPEFLFLEVKVGSVKILCGTIYGPYRGGYWSDVEEAILNCNNAYDYTVIMGDFNIDWLSNCSTGNILSDMLFSCHLERVPFGRTNHELRDGRLSHTTIDYICVSDFSKVTSFRQEHVPPISAHDVIFASLDYNVRKFSPTPIRRRSYKNFNLNNLFRDLDAVDWDFFDLLSNVDCKVEFLSDSLRRLYDTHAPFRVFLPKKPCSPWMSSAIRCLISARNNAWRACRRGGEPAARARYKSLCNSVQVSKRNAKFSYYKVRLSACN